MYPYLYVWNVHVYVFCWFFLLFTRLDANQLVSRPWSSPLYSRPPPGPISSSQSHATSSPPSSLGSQPVRPACRSRSRAAAAGHGLPHRPRQPQPLGHHREDHRRVHMVRRSFPSLCLALATSREESMLPGLPGRPFMAFPPSGNGVARGTLALFFFS
jgi:hypothetical protein